MIKISAVILTKNEEKNIRKCITTVRWSDEIIVIDDYSKDNTPEIAKSLNAKVYFRNLNGDFAGQRNFGLEKAKGEWVLFVDADERVPEALASEIKNDQLPMANYSGFYIRRQDVLWGKELKRGEVGNTWLLRLARKNVGRWGRRVHEVWDVKGRVGRLRNPLLHYPHQTLREFITDIDFYSTLHAQQKFEDEERSNLLNILVWPKLKFINNWIIKLGFLDETAGFVHAMMMSFHSFLAWSKLWLLQSKTRD